MSDPAPSGHLRNPPRQARSIARVEALLDAAEQLFEEVGYDAATTNHIADRADVPVGSLYRWFPDKSAIAEALTDRYLDDLRELYAELPSAIEPTDRISVFLRTFLEQLASTVAEHRALPALLVSALVPGRRSPAGERLRAGLLVEVRALIDLRVPDVPTTIRDDVAEVCVTLTHLVIAAGAEPAHRREVMVGEYVDVLIAYVEAKFPVRDAAVWADPDAPVTPVWPAPDRAQRVASTDPEL